MSHRPIRRLALPVVAVAVVAFAPTLEAQWSSPEAVATLTMRSGRVDVLRDDGPWAIDVGDAVRPKQVIATGPDGYAQFRVADGSTFEVFADSRVVFRPNQGDWKDLVDVWIGRIKVHIQKLGGRPNNNRVRTPTAVISVRGTIFHIDVEDDAGTTLVAVEEGLVDVRHVLMPGNAVALTEGESIRVFKNQPLAARSIDKGSLAQRAARAAAQAVAEILWRRQTAGGSGVPGTGGGTGSGGGVPADDKADDPPPPPPPPPPAP